MKTLILAALLGMVAVASMALAEPGGTYGRSQIYDIGNPGNKEAMTDCMTMPCCKGMSMEDMKDCADMPCCKTKTDKTACKKVIKSNKK